MARDLEDHDDFIEHRNTPLDDDDGICEHGKYYFQFCGVCDEIIERITNGSDDGEAPVLEFEDEEC